MIEQIRLKFGSGPGAAKLTFDPGNMTVIVGPNFSGKSKLIREIQQTVAHGETATDNVILESLSLTPILESDVDARIEAIQLSPLPTDVLNADSIIVGRFNHRVNISREVLRRGLLNFNKSSDILSFRQLIANAYFFAQTRLLNAESRIALTNDQPMGDLSLSPQTTFQLLFGDDNLRARVREIVADAFGLYLAVDPTSGG